LFLLVRALFLTFFTRTAYDVQPLWCLIEPA
jgi:hypothetical protein